MERERKKLDLTQIEEIRTDPDENGGSLLEN